MQIFPVSRRENKSGPGIQKSKNRDRDRDREWKKPGFPGPGPDPGPDVLNPNYNQCQAIIFHTKIWCDQNSHQNRFKM